MRGAWIDSLLVRVDRIRRRNARLWEANDRLLAENRRLRRIIDELRSEAVRALVQAESRGKLDGTENPDEGPTGERCSICGAELYGKDGGLKCKGCDCLLK